MLRKDRSFFIHIGLLVAFIFLGVESQAQDLYTARGYWVESTREPYLSITRKQAAGDSLSTQEVAYLQEYMAFLSQYYARLSPEEKQRYTQLKAQWDNELVAKGPVRLEEFEWRSRDRVLHTLYGMYYGASIVAITGMTDAAAAGVPLLTGGAWLLGPVVNPKKYEGITQTTVRASNSGKLLGLIYGASLGLAVAGESDNPEDFILGLSTVGSIAMGEVGFHLQKNKNLSDGHVEMLRHYGILGPGVGLSLIAVSGTENANLYGAGLLAGGAVGLIIGNQAAKKYDYTQGDVDMISSLALISTGLGFAVIAESLDEDDFSESLFLIPAAGAIAGTLFAQRSVKGVHFTKKQGSTANLATAGAALMGLGIMTLTETEAPAAWIGVPSALALITHQILFHKYKRANLTAVGFQGRHRRYPFAFSMKVMPENFFINQRLQPGDYSPKVNAERVNPMVKFKLTF